jgi:hypothetical protein
MFDLAFYYAIIGYCNYHKMVKEDPSKLIISPTAHCSRKTFKAHIEEIEDSLSIVNKCCYFCYYMKYFFSYFDLHYLKKNNHGYVISFCLLLFPCFQSKYLFAGGFVSVRLPLSLKVLLKKITMRRCHLHMGTIIWLIARWKP